MNINQAVVEIEKFMMYRQSMPEEGKLRNILEAVNTTTNSDMVPCPQYDAIDAGCPLHAHVWICGNKACMIARPKGKNK